MFTVPGDEKCWRNAGSYATFNGKTFFGPEWFLDVPFASGNSIEPGTRLAYYDGLTVVK